MFGSKYGSGTPPAPHFPRGLKRLAGPSDGHYDVEIVFIHGLMGDRQSTWTAAGKPQPWPQELLPPLVPTARIWTFGYDAYIARWEDLVSRNRIHNHTGNFLHNLSVHPGFNEGKPRPIIFVVHSMGGLVLADALSSAVNQEAAYQELNARTYGILFLGTPHHSGHFAGFAKKMARALDIVHDANHEILSALDRDSEVLARIQQAFNTMLRLRSERTGQSIGIVSFYEELPMPHGVGKIVDEESAVMPGYRTVGIHADHTQMTKFADAEDSGFVDVAGLLRQWVQLIAASGTIASTTSLNQSTSGDGGTGGDGSTGGDSGRQGSMQLTNQMDYRHYGRLMMTDPKAAMIYHTSFSAGSQPLPKPLAKLAGPTSPVPAPMPGYFSGASSSKQPQSFSMRIRSPVEQEELDRQLWMSVTMNRGPEQLKRALDLGANPNYEWISPLNHSRLSTLQAAVMNIKSLISTRDATTKTGIGGYWEKECYKRFAVYNLLLSYGADPSRVSQLDRNIIRECREWNRERGIGI